jgi:starch phosphorylase
MKEISTETLGTMQSGVSPQTEQRYRTDFHYNREIPENLRSLVEITWNYYWSWNAGGADLFRELAPSLWEKCEQNPRLLLKRIGQFRLWQKALDAEYVSKVDRFAEKLRNYLSEEPQNSGRVTTENPAAYFCAEYGVHNSLPNYSGGLGILAGDHLKSASDLNIPLVAVGLLYRYGYFRQKIRHDGWQEERYADVFESELALQPVLDENGERIHISVEIRGREVFAQGWLAQIGRIKLYLLDTNLPQNTRSTV